MPLAQRKRADRKRELIAEQARNVAGRRPIQMRGQGSGNATDRLPLPQLRQPGIGQCAVLRGIGAEVDLVQRGLGVAAVVRRILVNHRLQFGIAGFGAFGIGHCHRFQLAPHPPHHHFVPLVEAEPECFAVIDLIGDVIADQSVDFVLARHAVKAIVIALHQRADDHLIDHDPPLAQIGRAAG